MITGTIITDESITVIIDNKNVHTVRRNNTAFERLKIAISDNNENEVIRLLNPSAAIPAFSKGELVVSDGKVFYRGRELHGVDVDRIIEMLRENIDCSPILKFLEKKMKNPSARAINGLYHFLEHKSMPLTPNGNFLAYKGIDMDWYSVHGNPSTVLIKGTANSEGRILNKVGETVEVERSSVDDNFNNGCSFGLHAGSLQYASVWGNRVVIVEIDPADVVCIPEDESFQKLRCCKYRVVGEYDFENPLPNTVYKNLYDNEIVPGICPSKDKISSTKNDDKQYLTEDILQYYKTLNLSYDKTLKENKTDLRDLMGGNTHE